MPPFWQHLEMADGGEVVPDQSAGFGVYIHWPFCAATCPYCDFNSHVRAEIDQRRWAAAYAAEIARQGRLAPLGPATSVYFGGGTPSLMEEDTVAHILNAVESVWGLEPGAEVTLEANPTSVEHARFAGYRAAGVNRISLGVQALEDRALRALGRRHSVAEALAALDVARRIFDRLSFDLIYARQGQSEAAWKAELAQALDFGVDHLSLYQLTIEPGTAFGALHARGKLRELPSDDLAADLFDLTQDMTGAAGLPAYEVSNHAAPGQESRHNLVYWRAGSWVGVGPGAHGRYRDGTGRKETAQIRSPEDWLARAEAGGAGLQSVDRIESVDQAEEMLMMGLRLTEGVSLERLSSLGWTLDPAVASPLVELRLISIDGDRLYATRAGRPVLNAILGELLT